LETFLHQKPIDFTKTGSGQTFVTRSKREMRSPQGAVAINKGQSPVHDHTPPQQAQQQAQQEADDDDDEREL